MLEIFFTIARRADFITGEGGDRRLNLVIKTNECLGRLISRAVDRLQHCVAAERVREREREGKSEKEREMYI